MNIYIAVGIFTLICGVFGYLNSKLPEDFWSNIWEAIGPFIKMVIFTVGLFTILNSITHCIAPGMSVLGSDADLDIR
jgi:hypothetical protein